MTDQPHFTHDQVRAARDELGLTQAQLAAVLGCTLQHVKAMEAAPDRRNPRSVRPAYARLLRAYLDGYRPADWPA